MAWPTPDDAANWCTPDGRVTPAEQIEITDCLEAAIDYIIQHTTATTDEDYVPSASLRLACKLLTAGLYWRKQSPQGTAGFGDQGVVRVLANDPDVRKLLAAEMDWGIA